MIVKNYMNESRREERGVTMDSKLFFKYSGHQIYLPCAHAQGLSNRLCHGYIVITVVVMDTKITKSGDIGMSVKYCKKLVLRIECHDLHTS